MALATSGTINLTDIRDFYGLSGSINLTNLHKGENNVPDPATYATSNFTKTNDTNDGLPIELFDNGGVVPSLDTEANQNIPTSGSIDLTDYYGGYKIVNPTVTKASDGSSGVDLISSAVKQDVGLQTQCDQMRLIVAMLLIIKMQIVLYHIDITMVS